MCNFASVLFIKEKMTNDKLLSQTINYLRFPLIVGVVIVHNRMGVINIQGRPVSFGEWWPWLNYIFDFFSSVLGTISVPLFFFISGYLFFYKVDFNKSVYIRKLKNRKHTLLVPYLIWNFIGFLILLTQMHPRFSSLFPLLRDYRIDISEFLSYFWAKDLPMDILGGKGNPIDQPLWFVRDLMLFVVATPIVYWLTKKTKMVFLTLMGLVWFFQLGDYVNLPYTSNQSLFFLPLGAYFSINRINFVDIANKAKWLAWAYPLFAIADTITCRTYINFWIHNSGILIGMIATVYVASYLLKKNKVSINEFLCGASFFVFAAHYLFISKYMKILVMIIQPRSPFVVLFIYFFVPITTILLCLAIYGILRKWFPTAAKVLTGGR